MMRWFKGLFKEEQLEPEDTLAFSISNKSAIEKLCYRGGHINNTDLLNSALTVYQWALDAIESGKIVASLNETTSTYRELSIPSFASLKEQIPWGTWDLVSDDQASASEEDSEFGF